jgi:hypothetical protein
MPREYLATRLNGAGGKAKPYQVKQVREVILKYRLQGEEDNG